MSKINYDLQEMFEKPRLNSIFCLKPALNHIQLNIFAEMSLGYDVKFSRVFCRVNNQFFYKKIIIIIVQYKYIMNVNTNIKH